MYTDICYKYLHIKKSVDRSLLKDIHAYTPNTCLTVGLALTISSSNLLILNVIRKLYLSHDLGSNR